MIFAKFVLNLKTMDMKRLIHLAKKVSENAYAPYSRLKVGAAILTKTGKIFSGCNVENASYSLTICAERNALFSAVASGERDFVALALYSEDKMLPCGACLQVLSEFSDDMTIFVAWDGGVEEYRLSELLPKRFSL